MKYIQLNDTDLNVSRICLGTAGFGDKTDQEKSFEILDDFVRAGGNFIDTANVYSHGTSEIFIGNALKELNTPREKVVIASKVYFNPGKLSKEAIIRECDQSLKRLQTDYLDLYQIHRFLIMTLL